MALSEKAQELVRFLRKKGINVVAYEKSETLKIQGICGYEDFNNVVERQFVDVDLVLNGIASNSTVCELYKRYETEHPDAPERMSWIEFQRSEAARILEML